MEAVPASVPGIPAFLRDGGNMGAWMRRHDWSSGPLGLPAQWPAALRVALRIVLRASDPMCVWWGPERLCFYNDAYRAVLADDALQGRPGRPGQQLSARLWSALSPAIAAAMEDSDAPDGPSRPIVCNALPTGGRQCWAHDLSPLDDPAAAGGVGGVLARCHETPEENHPEWARAEQSLQQERVFEQAPGLVMVLHGAAHEVVFVNHAHRSLFGSDTWVGRPLCEAPPPAKVQDFITTLDRVFASGETFKAGAAPFQFLLRPDGAEDVRYLDFVYAPVKDAAGQVAGVFCKGFDVTGQVAAQAVTRASDARLKQVATALRGTEEQLRLATDAAEVGMWDVDPVTDTLFWPPRVKAMFGISADVPVSMVDFAEALHADDRERTVKAYAAAADPQQRAIYDVEYRTIGKEDGLLRWVAARGRGVFDSQGRCVRMIGTAIDISRRKQSELLLGQSEARLAETVATLDALLESAPIGFAFFDLQHRYVRLNAFVAAINGQPIDAHIGRTVAEMRPLQTSRAGAMIDQVAATGRAPPTIEVDGASLAYPGELRSWLTSFFPVVNRAGKVTHVGVTVVDITDRRRAESVVQVLNANLEAEVELRTAERDRVWRYSRDLIVVVDAAGVFLSVSPSCTAILGYEPHEMLGQPLSAFVVQDDIVETEAVLRVAAAGEDVTNFENRYRHKDGSARTISWRTAHEGGTVFAYGRDVTADKAKDEALARAESALWQAQKMEAVGQLTGGIAHDFNNLLQGVAGSLDLIRRRPGDTERVARWAEAGLRAAGRGSRLTGQLLAFSRSQKLELKPIVADELLARTRDMLERTLGPAVRVRMELECEGQRVLGDETQLEMAILNLAINARDAMPQGGEVAIRTRLLQQGEASDLPPGEYVELSVTDSGTGMAPEVAARAFDPFFTTKAIGKGTGLGLSQVYGTMRQAGGAVRIESKPGSGTTVRLYLCRTTRMPGPVLPRLPDRAAPSAPTAATVLVVDDDDDVRRFLADSLESLGYRVLQADDGPSGLAALERTVPDAMIVDFAMPGMTGAEVARQALAARPALPVIFASGFAETAAIEEVMGPDATVLHKPFRVDELQAVLENALARRA